MLRTGISVVRNAISNKKTSFNAVSLKAWRAFSTEETVKITYVDKEGVEHVVDAPIGKDLMTIAHDNEIDLEGACEGSLACSTCHVILEPDYFKKLTEPSDDELDMLDLAFGLKETSRLGCQVTVSKELEGARIQIPSASRNFYVDGHKPKPH
uniref:2Fe-2S ferredoxin n=1 Tax=Polytomella parva TaxID=51329 RepID=A0A7S0UIA1_9CHLO|mmetsp:Transcript_10009/g.18585  ORF Transcript_10009/g.18585 Transcript_10009/m.18585 type:complete len:153 (+) Transcript_10009:39-497(+)|eukprot:CAMPEP_0175073794 /NCGR_PEP_ID=MMETSP0052_2-20121109/20821_1 /TAXON_ID=51329 ORGANISM="Polytomella parva, Strain SAG 63-3" /NCGR_SAMPLE_ID=MMETSP0052_2 /ASSEMBLY_ACC=CAM_ASM_000194 /LENGTH=152 /DNA_ID=CAMNT_0016341765 /DNA_START=9 /DNA_END=467 /DNA_ORIENTATION=+